MIWVKAKKVFQGCLPTALIVYNCIPLKEAHLLTYESLHRMSLDKKLSSVLPPSHLQLSHTNVAQLYLLRCTLITLRLHSNLYYKFIFAFQRSSPVLYNYIECRQMHICRFLLSSIRSHRSEFDKYFWKDFIW